MSETVHLRRQAEFCLRLLQLCSGEPVSRHLSFLAAQYHEIALRAEFGVPSCVDDEAAEAQPLWH